MSTLIDTETVAANQPASFPPNLIQAGWRLETKAKESRPHRAKNDRLGLYTEAFASPHDAIGRAVELHRGYEMGDDRTVMLPEDLIARGWKLYERDGISPWHAENDKLDASTGGFPDAQGAIASAKAMTDEAEERAAIEDDGQRRADAQPAPATQLSVELESAVPSSLATAGWKLQQVFVDEEQRYRAYNEAFNLTTEKFLTPKDAIAAAELLHEHRDIAPRIQEAAQDSEQPVNSPTTFAEQVAEKVVFLNPKQIRTDGGTQPRTGLNLAHAAEIQEALERGAKLPAADVFYDGRDYWLSRGFHRHWAADKAGVLLRAQIHQGTQRDAILHSLGANATHGLPRTPEEKRGAVRKMLEDPEWSTWSDSVIAQKVNVSQPFVSKLRRELTSQNVLSEQMVRKGADGVVRDTAKIGTRPEVENRQVTIAEIDGVSQTARNDDRPAPEQLESGEEANGDTRTAVDVRTCRTCSCTDDKPCVGGCSWAEPDLCSQCAEAATAVIQPERFGTADIVAAIKENGGSMMRMELEDMGYTYAAILNALADEAITQPETGRFALPENPPLPSTEEPSTTHGAPAQTSTATARPRASIEDLLKGRMLSVSFVWIPGVKNKVQVSVNATSDPKKATRELIESERVRGFDESIQRMIVAQLNGGPAPQRQSSSPSTKKKASAKTATGTERNKAAKRAPKRTKVKNKIKPPAKKKSAAKGRKR